MQGHTFRKQRYIKIGKFSFQKESIEIAADIQIHPSYDPLLKQLYEHINKILNENNKFTGLKDVENINVLIGKNGTVVFSYKDKENKIPTQIVYNPDDQLKQIVVSLFNVVNIKKAGQKIRNFVAKRQDLGSPSRGEYKAEYIIYQRWHRMYGHIKRLAEDKAASTNMSKEAKASLKFFIIQYLYRVAAIEEEDSSKSQLSLSPLSKDFVGYFRFYEDHNTILAILDKAFPKLNTSLQFFSVNDYKQFCKTVAMVNKCDVCLVSFNDSSEIIRQKISSTNRTKENALMVQFEIHSDYIKDVEAINKLEKNIKDQLEILGIKKFQLMGFGKTPQEHHFIYGDSSLKQLCKPYGFTPTLQQTARILANEISLDQLALHIDELDKPTSLNKNEKKAQKQDEKLRVGTLVVQDFKEMLSNPTFKQFKKFGQNNRRTDIRILVEGICKYIEGFKKYQLDEIFAKNGLTTFLRETYAQVLNFMEVIMALNFHTDPAAKIKLSDFHTLIFENLNFWVEMCVDLNDASKNLSNNLKNLVMKNALIRPMMTGFVSNGMQCMTTILHACHTSQQEQKAENKSNKPKELQILAFNDCYFETIESLSQYNTYEVTPPDFEKSLSEKINALKKDGNKIDIVFVDPQGSLDTASPLVTSHNIDKIIGELRSSGVISKPLTIAMDLTIGKINDEKMAELINKYQTEIQRGELNLIFYRSIHKFDQLGLDKISGGYYQLYSNDMNFVASFNKFSTIEYMDSDPINIKVLNHFYECYLDGLDLYRSKTFENASYVHAGIDKAFLHGTSDQGNADFPFKIDQRINANNFFISLRNQGKKNEIMKFVSLLEKRGFLMNQRGSFGHPYTTMTGWSRGKENIVRINFGLEDKDQLDIFVDTINEYMRKDYIKKQILKNIRNPELVNGEVYSEILDLVDEVFYDCGAFKLDFPKFKQFIDFFLNPILVKCKFEQQNSPKIEIKAEGSFPQDILETIVLQMAKNRYQNNFLNHMKSLWKLYEAIHNNHRFKTGNIDLSLLADVYLGNKLDFNKYGCRSEDDMVMKMLDLLNLAIESFDENYVNSLISLINKIFANPEFATTLNQCIANKKSSSKLFYFTPPKMLAALEFATIADKQGQGEYLFLPLHFSVEKGATRVVETLLANGVDPGIKDNANRSALDLAFDLKQWPAAIKILQFLKPDSPILNKRFLNYSKNICDSLLDQFSSMSDEIKNKHIDQIINGENALKAILSKKDLERLKILRSVKNMYIDGRFRQVDPDHHRLLNSRQLKFMLLQSSHTQDTKDITPALTQDTKGITPTLTQDSKDILPTIKFVPISNYIPILNKIIQEAIEWSNKNPGKRLDDEYVLQILSLCVSEKFSLRELQRIKIGLRPSVYNITIPIGILEWINERPDPSENELTTYRDSGKLFEEARKWMLGILIEEATNLSKKEPDKRLDEIYVKKILDLCGGIEFPDYELSRIKSGEGLQSSPPYKIPEEIVKLIRDLLKTNEHEPPTYSEIVSGEKLNLVRKVLVEQATRVNKEPPAGAGNELQARVDDEFQTGADKEKKLTR